MRVTTVLTFFWKHFTLVYVDGGQFKVFKFKISWANFSAPPCVYFISSFSKSWKGFLEEDWRALNFPHFKWVTRKMYLHDTLTSVKLHFFKRANLVGMSGVLSAAKIFTSFGIEHSGSFFWKLRLGLLMVIMCTIHILVSELPIYWYWTLCHWQLSKQIDKAGKHFKNLEDWDDVSGVEPIDLTMKLYYNMICLQTILILSFLSFLIQRYQLMWWSN